MKIELNAYDDRSSIDSGIGGSGFVFELKQQYSGLSVDSAIDVASWPESDQSAFKQVVDKLTFLVCENATIWKVIKADKEFDLSTSYVRNVIDSSDGDTIANGTPLRVRFETPGFGSFNIRVISLWYNQAFDPADLDLLEEIGVTLSGNGKTFEISNTVECRVHFLVPNVGGPYNYIIRNDYSNDIILP